MSGGAAVLFAGHGFVLGKKERRAQSRVGIALELRVATRALAANFARLLRSHALRADALIYVWADKHLAGSTRSMLMAYLREVHDEVFEPGSRDVDLEAMPGRGRS